MSFFPRKEVHSCSASSGFRLARVCGFLSLLCSASHNRESSSVRQLSAVARCCMELIFISGFLACSGCEPVLYWRIGLIQALEVIPPSARSYISTAARIPVCISQNEALGLLLPYRTLYQHCTIGRFEVLGTATSTRCTLSSQRERFYSACSSWAGTCCVARKGYLGWQL